METWDLLQQSEHLYMYGILTLRYQLQTLSITNAITMYVVY